MLRSLIPKFQLPLGRSWYSSIFYISKYLARRYTSDHEWVSLNNGVATIGISDYAQKALGDVVYIEFPQVGASFNQKDPLGAVESVKAASDIYAPISGSVLKVNQELEGKPGLINSSPFDQGWIVQLKCNDAKQLENLLDEESYKKYIDSL